MPGRRTAVVFFLRPRRPYLVMIYTANRGKKIKTSPFFVFETPTLSTHSKDLGDEFGDDSAGAAGACSSCGAGGGPEDRSRFLSPRRRSANGGIDDYDDDASRPSFYRSPPHKRGDRRSSGPASRRAARDTSRAAVAGKKQASRAASLLYSSLRFASAVRSETLPPGEFVPVDDYRT